MGVIEWLLVFLCLSAITCAGENSRGIGQAVAFVSNHNMKTNRRSRALGTRHFGLYDKDYNSPERLVLTPSDAAKFRYNPTEFLKGRRQQQERQAPTKAMLLGTICHRALELLFLMKQDNRTLGMLYRLFLSSWADYAKTNDYKLAFALERNVYGHNSAIEQEWKIRGLELMENYFSLEDPRDVTVLKTEMKLLWSNLPLDPLMGSTSPSRNVNGSNTKITAETFPVSGRLDRLDLVRLSSQQGVYEIVDYKTSKAPAFGSKQSESDIYQLLIYALLLRETGHKYIRFLRIMYLTCEMGKGRCDTMDLGETQEERDAKLQKVHRDLARDWLAIQKKVPF